MRRIKFANSYRIVTELIRFLVMANTLKNDAKEYERLRAVLAQRKKETSTLNKKFNTHKKVLLNHLVKRSGDSNTRLTVCGYQLTATTKESKSRIGEKLMLKTVRSYCDQNPEHRKVIMRFMTFMERKRGVSRTTYLSRRKITPSKRRHKRQDKHGKSSKYVDWVAVIMGQSKSVQPPPKPSFTRLQLSHQQSHYSDSELTFRKRNSSIRPSGISSSSENDVKRRYRSGPGQPQSRHNQTPTPRTPKSSRGYYLSDEPLQSNNNNTHSI